MFELRLIRGEATIRQRSFESGPVRIGRDPEGDIAITADPEVSRRHLRLDRKGDRWLLQDEGSANGTFVNGERTAGAAHELHPGDVITLGGPALTEFLWHQGGDASSFRLSLEGSGFKEQLLFSSLLGGSDLKSLTRARDRLYVLYEASRAVFSRVLDFRDLLDRIKEEIVRALGVDEMIVALREGGQITYDVVNRRDRFRSTEIAGSKSLIARVLEGGRAVWVNPDEAPATGNTSFARHHIRTAMCVPLVVRNEVLGAIYVQNPEGGGAVFTPADFDFLTAFAAQAALAIHTARSAEERSRLLEEARRENLELQAGLDTRDPLAAIVGDSEPIRSIKKLIEAVKDLPSTVLVTGESGTGKELVAKALHYGGVRRDKPFVSISVAAFAEGLLESELFGHEKGAFTGAVGRKIGKFELARGGTLFLDEIGEVPLNVQVKFLRVLQERKFERVGGNQSIETDVRFVFATNRDLHAMTEKGEFREDLFYRVNVVPLEIPPLRDRRLDILPLAEALVRRLRGKLGIEVRGITETGQKALLAYDYPGNVRELENLLERAFIRLKIRGGDRVDVDDLPFELRQATPGGAPSSEAAIPESYEGLRKIEREMILGALRRTGWNKRKAAQLLGITHQTLYSRIAEFELPRDRE